MEYRIQVPNQASVQVLEGFLRRNDFFPPDASGFVVEFHPRFVYLQPFALAMLAAWGENRRTAGMCIRVEGAIPRSLAYAWRMGLFDFLGVDYQPGRAMHEEAGRFIPLRRISKGQDLAAFLNDVAALLHRPEHAPAVRYCLSETIRNVLEHAGGEAAFACAQYYRKTNRVSIGVADCGIGILGSLRKAHDYQADEEAILAALRPGITGAPRGMYGTPDNAGVGLFFTKCIAKASHQYFAILSGGAAYRLRRVGAVEAFHLYADPTRDRHDLFRDLPRWGGTVVAVDIGVTPMRSFEETMAAIREAMGAHRPRRERPKVRFI